MNQCLHQSDAVSDGVEVPVQLGFPTSAVGFTEDVLKLKYKTYLQTLTIVISYFL